MAWSAPSHYLNQRWNNVNWTLGNKLQWNLNRNLTIFIQENAFENVVWKMVAILSRPQCVNCLVEARPSWPVAIMTNTLYCFIDQRPPRKQENRPTLIAQNGVLMRQMAFTLVCQPRQMAFTLVCQRGVRDASEFYGVKFETLIFITVAIFVIYIY